MDRRRAGALFGIEHGEHVNQQKSNSLALGLFRSQRDAYGESLIPAETAVPVEEPVVAFRLKRPICVG